MPTDNLQYIVYVLIFISTIMIVDGLIRFTSSRFSYKKSKNKRLKLISKNIDHSEALSELRRQRGLSNEGNYLIPFIPLNKLIMQSGIHIGIRNIILLMCLLSIASFILVYVFDNNVIFPTIAAFMVGIILPITFLSVMRRRRRKKIETQLPEALDILRRSLRAGHPLSVAISMVAREMPDPIGSEFGMTSDEMTYGSDLESALENMAARIGQPDVSLMVLSVTVQSKTGGNLTELLANLSVIVRERQTLRRKVRALSAEGRFSAIALSLLPLFVFGVLLVIAPSLYGQVWDHPLVKPVLGFAIVLTVIGDFVMYRMVNFKY
jgi:tight adherence protein B